MDNNDALRCWLTLCYGTGLVAGMQAAAALMEHADGQALRESVKMLDARYGVASEVVDSLLPDAPRPDTQPEQGRANLPRVTI